MQDNGSVCEVVPGKFLSTCRLPVA